MKEKISQKIIVPVILAGGKGSRLWPISRKSFPKQFIEIFNDDNFSLLQKTYKRIEELENITNPIIICNEEHRFIVGDQMKKINTAPLSIILEPEGRNTAPAITIAALKALEHFDDPILLILSADHQVEDINNFKVAIKNSVRTIVNESICIFGVIPTYPATGYGYIESFKKLDKDNLNPIKVTKFIEKPNIETARKLIKDKKYSWNSGMFVFKANTILKEISNFTPDILKNCRECLKESNKDLDFHRLNKEIFLKCRDISIDVAVLEKTEKAFVFPLFCGWDDIGSWYSLWKISNKDLNGNSIKGEVIVKDSTNSLFRSEDRLIVGLGLKDLIIIETKDVVLVADKNISQDVKKIVSFLNENGYKEGEQHKKVYRPWGNYFSIEEKKNWQIKKIEVNPGASLSLQKHFHRSEHWVVVEGNAKVQVENEIKILSKNESIYIPLGSKHRLSNPDKKPLIIIEIQSGNYLGEDDIIRFKDDYGRDN